MVIAPGPAAQPMMRVAPSTRRAGPLGMAPLLGLLWIAYNIPLVVGVVPAGLPRVLVAIPMPS